MSNRTTLSWFDQHVKHHPEAEQLRPHVERLFESAADAERRCIDLDEILIEVCKERDMLAEQRTDIELGQEVIYLRQALDGQKARWRRYMELQAAIFDKASTYTNLLISAGYVGLFATWHLSKDFIAPSQNRIVAVSLVASLFFFIGWEVAKMIHGGLVVRKQAQLLSEVEPHQFKQAEERLQGQHDFWKNYFERHWVVVLVLTIAPGLFAAVLLVASLLERELS